MTDREIDNAGLTGYLEYKGTKVFLDRLGSNAGAMSFLDIPGERAMAGKAAAQHIPEVEYFLETGRVSLLYPAADGQAEKMPAVKVIDLHPSPAGGANVSAKRASILGRPLVREEIVVAEGMVEESIARDESGAAGFGQKVLLVADGTTYVGSEGAARRAFPDEMEREERLRAGMIVGDLPHSIIKIPLSAS